MDSSESSSDEVEDKESSANRAEEVEELAKIFADVSRENRELEVSFQRAFLGPGNFNMLSFFCPQEKRRELCQKIQEERAACVNLRVEIRLEQAKQRMRKEKREKAGDLMH